MFNDDDGDDGDDDDDGGDDDDGDDEGIMMMWMVKRRKAMVLRRKTDPKTGKHILWAPAQLKRTWTFEKNHVVWTFPRKVLRL